FLPPSLSGNSVTTAQAQNYVRERNSFSLSANFWIYATLENKRQYSSIWMEKESYERCLASRN
ncbi:MAG: hypothetical protein EZS28_055077, partial [Streblomastix strix]